jgi:plasmid stability protein
MKTLTIRNVPRRLAAALERERRRSGASLNRTVLDLLSRGLGVEDTPRRNGLAGLAGSWTEEEHQAFEAAVAPFGVIDDEVWR